MLPVSDKSPKTKSFNVFSYSLSFVLSGSVFSFLSFLACIRKERKERKQVKKKKKINYYIAIHICNNDIIKILYYVNKCSQFFLLLQNDSVSRYMHVVVDTACFSIFTIALSFSTSLYIRFTQSHFDISTHGLV